MYYETMPLYPAIRPGCEAENCVRVPVFDGDEGPRGPMPELRSCRRLTIENPCRPGERADVLLGLDAFGNLVVCVRRGPDREPCCRPQRPCRPPRPLPCAPEPRCGGRGKLYGSWR